MPVKHGNASFVKPCFLVISPPTDPLRDISPPLVCIVIDGTFDPSPVSILMPVATEVTPHPGLSTTTGILVKLLQFKDTPLITEPLEVDREIAGEHP